MPSLYWIRYYSSPQKKKKRKFCHQYTIEHIKFDKSSNMLVWHNGTYLIGFRVSSKDTWASSLLFNIWIKQHNSYCLCLQCLWRVSFGCVNFQWRDRNLSGFITNFQTKSYVFVRTWGWVNKLKFQWNTGLSAWQLLFCQLSTGK